jgi:hypothetical protein
MYRNVTSPALYTEFQSKIYDLLTCKEAKISTIVLGTNTSKKVVPFKFKHFTLTKQTPPELGAVSMHQVYFQQNNVIDITENSLQALWKKFIST